MKNSSYATCDVFDLLGVPDLCSSEKDLFLIALQEAAWLDFLHFDLAFLLSDTDYMHFIEGFDFSKVVETKALWSSALSILLPNIKTLLANKVKSFKRVLIDEHVNLLVCFSCQPDIGITIEQIKSYMKHNDWGSAAGLLKERSIYPNVEALLYLVKRVADLSALEHRPLSHKDKAQDMKDRDAYADSQDAITSTVEICGGQPASVKDVAALLAQQLKEIARRKTEGDELHTKISESPNQDLPKYNLSAAVREYKDSLSRAVISDPFIAKELEFIDFYSKFASVPKYCLFIDCDNALYVERTASVLAGQFVKTKTKTENTPCRILSVKDLKSKITRNSDTAFNYEALSNILDCSIVCFENMDLLASLTNEEFSDLLRFLKFNRKNHFLFFGDFDFKCGSSGQRLEALRKIMNCRDLSLRCIDTQEDKILFRAFTSAGFVIKDADICELNLAWFTFKQQMLSERVDNLFADFLSKTVFNVISRKIYHAGLDKNSFSWLDLKTADVCFDYTSGRPRALERLDRMSGLHNVKKEIEKIVSHVAVAKMKVDAGLLTELPNLNFLFTGNPGTGKTTVAYILAQALKELGILKSGHLVSASRGTLVAQYLGQTGPLVIDTLNSALGGVLLVDEAYSLYTADLSLDSYGKEAINTFTLLLPEYRGRLAVIFCGYEEEMDYMLKNVNPGLRDRFCYKLHFEDYSKDELMDIFISKIKAAGMCVQQDGLASIEKQISEIWNNKDEQFANGRAVENIIQMLISEQENRLALKKYCGENISKEDLTTITREDCEIIFSNESLQTYGKKKPSLGFNCAVESQF